MSRIYLGGIFGWLIFSCGVFGQSSMMDSAWFSVYASKPISLSIQGQSPAYPKDEAFWQSAVVGGYGASRYEFFLLRPHFGGAEKMIDVVFFNKNGVGYYVRFSNVELGKESMAFTVNRRGGGESGLWNTRHRFVFSVLEKSQPRRIKVTIEEEIKITTLFILSRRETWRAEIVLEEQLLETGLIDKAKAISIQLNGAKPKGG